MSEEASAMRRAMDGINEVAGGLAQMEREGYQRAILTLIDENVDLRQEVILLRARIAALESKGKGTVDGVS